MPPHNPIGRPRLTCSQKCRDEKHRRAKGMAPQHIAQCGSMTKYRNGCRCEDCRKANAAHARKERARWRERGQLPASGAHNVSTYRNYGCRCDVCKAAMKAKNARRYQKAAA